MLRWFEKDGPEGDVVISSRVRLARNLPNYNFSLKLSDEEAVRMIEETSSKISGIKQVKDFVSFNFDNLDVFQKMAMQERHVISPFLLNQKKAAGMVSLDESISIMLNEEDHIRIQAFVPGMNMIGAYKNADAIDDNVGNVLEYAYSPKYGYLTTCPSNVGTGMRVSYMLHLPGLSASNTLNGIAREVGRFGLTMRGVYGEGTTGIGDIYQVSNQVTLGHSEMEIIENLNNIVRQIVEQERAIRRQYVSKRKVVAEDAAYRSYGVLKYSRKLSLNDAMVLLSELRLGFSQGLLKPADEDNYSTYQLMIGIQPGNLQLISGQELSAEEIEIKRSEFVRDNLPPIQ